MTITSRIDAITGIPDEYRVANPPCPRSVKIELTGRCNFACSFCARSKKLREQGDMDRKLFESLLWEMRAVGVEEIGLFYLGESLLCKWLAEAVFFAKRGVEYPYVFLTTNGSLIDGAKAQALMGNGLDSLKFSLNYADEAQFKDIARVKGALFHKMIANIKTAREVRDNGGYSCGLYASYIQYDGAQAEKMEKIIEEIKPYVDEIYALPLYTQGGYVTEDERKLGWEPTPGNRGRIGALRDPLPCWACFTEAHITFDGKLSACCFDHEAKWTMGDLTNRAFMSAWGSEKFQKLREAHLKLDVSGTACESCLIA